MSGKRVKLFAVFMIRLLVVLKRNISVPGYHRVTTPSKKMFFLFFFLILFCYIKILSFACKGLCTFLFGLFELFRCFVQRLNNGIGESQGPIEDGERNGWYFAKG